MNSGISRLQAWRGFNVHKGEKPSDGKTLDKTSPCNYFCYDSEARELRE